jgi:integrase
MSPFLGALYQTYDLVYDSVYGFDQNFYYLAGRETNFDKLKVMSKPNYSIPKIYTGGEDITVWNKLSKETQLESLKKDWYIYYSFRFPETGKLKRQTPIKGQSNSYKNKKQRYKYLTVMRDALELLLKNGANPYTENDFGYLNMVSNNVKPTKEATEVVEVSEAAVISEVAKVVEVVESLEAVKAKPKVVESKIVEIPNVETTSIKVAFETVSKIKSSVMNKTSYSSYKLRINKFLNSLPDSSLPITSLIKKDVNLFLNKILAETTPRNRNNYRADLNSFFNELENNEFIASNFITKISVLKSIPERNKTFSDAMQKDIYTYLEEKDALLLLFIQFISFNFLRPVEVCRLKIKDIDIAEKKIYIRTKNKPVKIKIIPDLLIEKLPDLQVLNPDTFLFTPAGYGKEWVTEENNKRNYFSKRFNEVVKTKFSLDKDYGLYSFRHTFITRLYRNIREKKSQQIAKSELMLITGHSTITALDKYLRDIDAELPEDYSDMLQ